MPPDLRNHLEPTGGDTPASRAASSLERPVAIAAQNRTSSSRRAESGRPGECNLLRPDRSDRRLRSVIATSYARVLRRPIELALFPSIQHDVIQRAKLRVDTRMKIAAKINPAKYGERLELAGGRGGGKGHDGREAAGFHCWPVGPASVSTQTAWRRWYPWGTGSRRGTEGCWRNRLPPTRESRQLVTARPLGYPLFYPQVGAMLRRGGPRQEPFPVPTDPTSPASAGRRVHRGGPLYKGDVRVLRPEKIGRHGRSPALWPGHFGCSK